MLLYRKHVITEQPYIAQLIETMEAEGLRPLPIFINGVEAHTVVRPLGGFFLFCRSAAARPMCNLLLRSSRPALQPAHLAMVHPLPLSTDPCMCVCP